MHLPLSGFPALLQAVEIRLVGQVRHGCWPSSLGKVVCEVLCAFYCIICLSSMALSCDFFVPFFFWCASHVYICYIYHMSSVLIPLICYHPS